MRTGPYEVQVTMGYFDDGEHRISRPETVAVFNSYDIATEFIGRLIAIAAEEGLGKTQRKAAPNERQIHGASGMRG